MKDRCLNPNHQAYKDYGGRGIAVCEKWMKFEGFIEDMGMRPTGMTLDRIDVNRGYYKENCRWATPKQQSSNSRRNVRISFRGVTKLISEWAVDLGINNQTLSERFSRGWSIEKMLTTPVRKKKK